MKAKKKRTMYYQSMIDRASTSGLALISACTAVAAVIVGPAVTMLLTRKQLAAAKVVADNQLAATRRTANKQAVAPMRQAWINALREKVAQFLAATTQLSTNLQDVTSSEIVAFARIQYEMILMLNPKKETHQALEKLIEELVISVGNGTLTKELYWQYRVQVVEAARTVFKREWDRIKTEDAN